MFSAYFLCVGVDDHLIDKILDPSHPDGGSHPFSSLRGILKSSGTSAVAWVGEAGGFLDQLGMASSSKLNESAVNAVVNVVTSIHQCSSVAPFDGKKCPVDYSLWDEQNMRLCSLCNSIGQGKIGGGNHVDMVLDAGRAACGRVDEKGKMDSMKRTCLDTKILDVEGS
ncbi:hypothetical protein POTOM_026465 [Populus tomentosa]|uniref:Uncharacterized protein n=1 Tax=Populus tomentosa TaxID=118781 RepID=A0A8X7ZKN3_POPTO|nr:hypothetical protein POTOM_026465 [Populus tomentosa]